MKMYRKLYMLLLGIDFTKIVQLAQKETGISLCKKRWKNMDNICLLCGKQVIHIAKVEKRDDKTSY